MLKTNIINTMKKIVSLILIAILATLSIKAQTIYEVYDPLADTVTVKQTSDSENQNELRIARNQEVIAIAVGKDSTKNVIIQENGIKYSINAKYLYYSEKNPHGTTDYTKGMILCPNSNSTQNSNAFNSWRARDSVGQFLYSHTLQWIVLITVIVLQLLMVSYKRVQNKKNSLKNIYLLLMPLLLLITVGIEAAYLLYMGTEVAWWIDMDIIGFWNSLILCICTGAVFAAQTSAFFAYKKIIAGGKKLAVKPIFWGVALFIPVGVLVTIASAVCVAYEVYPAEYEQIVTIIAAGITFCAFVIFGMVKNMAQVGALRGLLFSLFTFIAAIGTICVGAILLYAGGQVVITIIAASIPFVLLFGFLMGGGSRTTVTNGGGGGGTQSNGSSEKIMIERKDAAGNTTYIDWVDKNSTY